MARVLVHQLLPPIRELPLALLLLLLALLLVPALLLIVAALLLLRRPILLVLLRGTRGTIEELALLLVASLPHTHEDGSLGVVAVQAHLIAVVQEVGLAAVQRVPLTAGHAPERRSSALGTEHRAIV